MKYPRRAQACAARRPKNSFGTAALPSTCRRTVFRSRAAREIGYPTRVRSPVPFGAEEGTQGASRRCGCPRNCRQRADLPLMPLVSPGRPGAGADLSARRPAGLKVRACQPASGGVYRCVGRGATLSRCPVESRLLRSVYRVACRAPVGLSGARAHRRGRRRRTVPDQAAGRSARREPGTRDRCRRAQVRLGCDRRDQSREPADTRHPRRRGRRARARLARCAARPARGRGSRARRRSRAGRERRCTQPDAEPARRSRPRGARRQPHVRRAAARSARDGSAPRRAVAEILDPVRRRRIGRRARSSARHLARRMAPRRRRDAHRGRPRRLSADFARRRPPRPSTWRRSTRSHSFARCCTRSSISHRPTSRGCVRCSPRAAKLRC